MPHWASAKASTMNTPSLPRALRAGDKVGLIAPASRSVDAADVQRARANIERLGLEVVMGRSILNRHGYFAGTDAERAEDFNVFARLPQIRGIFCTRGGWGTPRILRDLDYEAFKADPKPVIGFSDITGLLNALTRETGVVTFHGPTASSNWGEMDLTYMRRALFEPEALGVFPRPLGNPDPASVTLVPGRAEGRLAGGNLSLLSAVGGSKYFPSLKGAILCIEEIGEEPYRVDRMLNQLWLSGELTGVRGVGFGNMRLRASQTPDDDPEDFTMIDVLKDFAERLGVPACTGLPFGHIADQVTLPIGVRAQLDADQQLLTMVESAVAG